MLQLIDVSKTFNPGTVNEKKALSHLNLELQDGDFATIIGSNGAGKSTMFNAICGTFFADEGAVILDGTDITYEKEYKRSKYIGHLFQDPMKGTAPNMSIEENLALAYLRASAVKGKFFSRISQKEKQMFREKLALLDMGLEDRMKNPVGLLSGGQRQALTLLMATVVTPKILLLDEPLSALDGVIKESIKEKIKEIARDFHLTTIIVTHDPEEALTLSDKVLIVNKGSISQYGAPQEIITAPENNFVKEFILNQLEIKKNNIFALFHQSMARTVQAGARL